ncbi:40S ribosomal protein S2 [Galemys pyrenaicus]|uniref:40S ribosomal protein S2 n=1 Tax=Galemys pyrenaicus TaxID=202257 RepID=A0A8J6AC15_GALPY|nr:40S ribosomal protein S2 [Galemys pyrenaicus]
MKIEFLEEIYLFSLTVKEPEIIDFFSLGPFGKGEVLTVMPLQKRIRAGQQVRLKAFVSWGIVTDTLLWVLSAPRSKASEETISASPTLSLARRLAAGCVGTSHPCPLGPCAQEAADDILLQDYLLQDIHAHPTLPLGSSVRPPLIISSVTTAVSATNLWKETMFTNSFY